MIDYNDKVFRSVQDEGDAAKATVFHFQQQGFLVSATYSGGPVIFGHLIGLVDDKGAMDVRYHHVNDEGNLLIGGAMCAPEAKENAGVRLAGSRRGDDTEGLEIEVRLEEMLERP